MDHPHHPSSNLSSSLFRQLYHHWKLISKLYYFPRHFLVSQSVYHLMLFSLPIPFVVVPLPLTFDDNI